MVAVALAALWVSNRGDVNGPTVAGGSSDVGSAGGTAGAAGATTAPVSADDESTLGEVVATDPAPSYGGGDKNVVITQAGWTADERVEVSGYVPGVVEDGGTCRVTLTLDGDTVQAEAVGMADATTTVCGAIEVGGPELDPGLWQAVLSYESPTSSGASAPSIVQVPTR